MDVVWTATRNAAGGRKLHAFPVGADDTMFSRCGMIGFEQRLFLPVTAMVQRCRRCEHQLELDARRAQ